MIDRWALSPNLSRYLKIGGISVAALAILMLLFLGALPVWFLKSTIENRISGAVGAPVTMQSISRRQLFSYNPDIVMRSVRIRQPAWVGPGDFLTAKTVDVRISVWDVVFGRIRPERVLVEGITLNLYRDKIGRSNWDSKGEDDDERPSEPIELDNLSIRDFRFTLNDKKRALGLAGTVDANAGKGLTIRAEGQYLGTPATLLVRGGAFGKGRADRAYPFSVALKSPAAELEAAGTMLTLFDIDHFDARITARAPTLKNIDYLIEAGLFGTQPVNLRGNVRHAGRDWFIKDLNGSVGRSDIAGHADVVKRGGRTKVTGAIRSNGFDFDDLADNAGLARAAALRARIGPRVIPNTRINLSKIGKTDIAMTFNAARLLSMNDSIFRSLSANLSLDHRLVKATNIIARMDSGRMTGSVTLDHRTGSPKLRTDLVFRDASLQTIFGSPDIITGPVEGRIRLAGSGDTVREALSRASGKASIIARSGSIKAIVADVIGQDLGKAIGQVIGRPNGRDPLHCLIASFNASGGKFAPAPLVISAGSSVGRGYGTIDLDGETLALTIRGAATKQSPFKIADPIRVGGTLSVPKVSVAGFSANTKPTLGGGLKIFGKSIGRALGIGKKDTVKVKSVAVPVNCAGLASAALS